MTGNISHKTCLSGVGPLAMALWLLGLAFTATAAQQDNVHFYGALVAEPCVIPPGQEEILLDFGTIVDKYLYLNQRTRGQRFELQLADCDLSLGKTVKVTFLGMENPALPGLLAVEANSQAKGIAIGLETMAGEALPLNKPGGKYELLKGSNVIALKAYVRGEAQAIENHTIARGPFSAVTTFKLDYE